MGNQHSTSRISESSNDFDDSVIVPALSVNADVSFRTSNYSTVKCNVDYKVIVVTCPNPVNPHQHHHQQLEGEQPPPLKLLSKSEIDSRKVNPFSNKEIGFDLISEHQRPSPPYRGRSMSALAEQRRALINQEPQVLQLIDTGYKFVTICPFKKDDLIHHRVDNLHLDTKNPPDDMFMIIMMKTLEIDNKLPGVDGINELHSEENVRFTNNIVNTKVNLQRLVGETLVVGSQKLVLAGSDNTTGGTIDGEDLLVTIAHETANGGRLIAAWMISDAGQNADRVDLLFALPEGGANNIDFTEYFAYQISVTDNPFDSYELSLDEDHRHRNVNLISNYMQKTLEAGWSVVDVILVRSNVLVWILERKVTDALINEPQYEGRLVEVVVNKSDQSAVCEIETALDTFGQEGWFLKAVLNLPLDVTNGNRNVYIVFLQRTVERISGASSMGGIRSSVNGNLFSTQESAPRAQSCCYTGERESSVANNSFTTTNQDGVRGGFDRFAPPTYAHSPSLRPFSDISTSSNHFKHSDQSNECKLPSTIPFTTTSTHSDDESELPLYEDAIQ